MLLVILFVILFVMRHMHLAYAGKLLNAYYPKQLTVCMLPLPEHDGRFFALQHQGADYA